MAAPPARWVRVPSAGTGTLAFNRSDDITVSTAIGSSLNLAQLGTNTVTLTGTNTYTGTTTIASAPR